MLTRVYALTIIILYIDYGCLVRFNVYNVALVPSGGHCTQLQSNHLKLLQGNLIVSQLQWQGLTRIVIDGQHCLMKVEGPSRCIVKMVGYMCTTELLVASIILN